MKEVYCQPYSKKKHISGYFGKPPKGVFKYDEIGVHLGNACEKCGSNIYVTPDEAVALIRAISASLHFWVVKNTNKIIKAKGK